MNSDAIDFILPDPGRQAQCIRLALDKAGLKPGDIDILNAHATATQMGDIQEVQALREVFGENSKTRINNTKSFIGHTMGAAGTLELSGNLPSFDDLMVHPTINLDDLDPECALNNLVANKPAFVQVAPGAGPRHFAFHTDGPRAYVLNEIGNTVTAFNWDPGSGSLEEFQTVTTLPTEFSETSHTADLHIHPNGRFLYGSNRGHDSKAIFEIDPDAGGLTLRGWASTQGRTPRNIAIDPSGQFMLAANQDSDSIFTFRINDETGMLITTGSVTEVPMPVCIKFLA